VILTAMGDMFEDKLTASLKRLSKQEPQRVQVPPEAQFVGFDAYQRVIDSGVDVVILTTTPNFRPLHLRAAVDAGKHVFTEKPMAVDSAGIRSVLRSVEDARQQGLSVVAGFCWRYSYPERATFGRVQEGAVGDVLSVHTTYHASPLKTFPRQATWSDMEWQLRNWWHFRWLSGDHIVEQACHSIDKINWAMGGRVPVRANALGGRQMREGPETGNVYDHFTVIYDYDDGARCFHTCRQMPNCAFDNTDYIMGNRGTCFVNGWGPTHVIKGENPWTYDGEHPNMYQVEHNELFASRADQRRHLDDQQQPDGDHGPDGGLQRPDRDVGAGVERRRGLVPDRVLAERPGRAAGGRARRVHRSRPRGFVRSDDDAPEIPENRQRPAGGGGVAGVRTDHASRDPQGGQVRDDRG
jgi:predicted dehydrogenase